MEFIDLKAQYKNIKNRVLAQIENVLDNGQYIMGTQVKTLEDKLVEYTNGHYCIGVADGTKALLIALMALGIKPNDEVIVPAFTFVATASMVKLLGATPVFADIDPISYNIDPKQIENLITNNTKVIITVGLFGQCADMDAINHIANKYNLAVIEDAAQSFGATYKGKHSTNLSTIGCTSFFPSKPLGCYGDGGACFTQNIELATKMKQIRIHGQDMRYHHAILGVNGRLDTLQAAILLTKLEIFPMEVIRRQEIGTRYNQLLSGTNCIIPKTIEGNTHVYAQYSILVNDRKNFIEKLNNAGIPTSIHYPIPLHKQPILVEYYRGQNLEISEDVANRIVSIPMHPYLDYEQQDKIINIVKQSL
jgi:UDP-2-acetamido-2-deoxy-ribo-hexuluronate aminotransferase